MENYKIGDGMKNLFPHDEDDGSQGMSLSESIATIALAIGIVILLAKLLV